VNSDASTELDSPSTEDIGALPCDYTSKSEATSSTLSSDVRVNDAPRGVMRFREEDEDEVLPCTRRPRLSKRASKTCQTRAKPS
jgi:hypothetical protein